MKLMFRFEGDLKKKDDSGKPIIVRDSIFVISDSRGHALAEVETFATNVKFIYESNNLNKDWI